ncbi:MAG: LamG domain-containing protein [Candidatus Poribacteria bacterium]|nr:LamG domain-containing protein [Candidatus Poribacteria bacterium]
MGRLFCYPLFFILMLVSVGYATADLTDDLVVHFTFDTVKGKTIVDESGNGLDAKVIKNTEFVKGKYGKAIHITKETEDCVNVPASHELEISEEITMMAWVYQDDWTESTFQWLDKGSYSKAFHSVYGMAVFNKDAHSPGIGVILGGDIHRRFIVRNNMRNKKWHHIAATCNDTSVKIYLNGELLNPPGRLPPELKLNFRGINDEDLRIGCAKGKPGYAFEDGSIDEVAIWSRALSEDEIGSAMQGRWLSVSPKDKVATTWGNIKRTAFQP